MTWRSSGDHDMGLERSLRNILQRNPDIEGIAVVTTDGNHIASILPDRIKDEDISTISASFAESAALGSGLVQLLKRGNRRPEIYVKSRVGYIIVQTLKENRLLVSLCK